MYMKLSAKTIVQTGILLAICIISQWIKGVSVYITGTIVNMTIVLAILLVGAGSGIILSIIAPITSFFISPSPITSGIPAVIPCIMIGNALLAIGIALFQRRVAAKTMSEEKRVIIGMGVGAIAKAAFMGISIVLILLPMLSSHINVPKKKLDIILSTAKVTFSVTQLITAVLGCILAYVIWLRIRGSVNKM